MFRHAWHVMAVSALIVAVTLAGGCAGKPLTETDRAELRKQPIIQVVHYATPTPSVEVVDKRQVAPSGKEVMSYLGGYDPTLDLTRRFSGMLGRSAGLKNLRLVNETAPLPPTKDAKGFQVRYKNGAVLEVWIDRWGFQSVPTDLKAHALTLNAKARLTRMRDGQVLWSTGSCSYASTGKNSNERIVLADIKPGNNRKTPAKFRQAMGQIADSCAQQLLREYLKTN